MSKFNLIELLKSIKIGSRYEGWLYVKKSIGSKEFSKESLACFLDPDEFDGEDPPFAIKNHLHCTMDFWTVRSIIDFASELEPSSDDFLIESFNYYFKYDAFLPEKGFIPISNEEAIHNIDLEFYNKLIENDKGRVCRKEGCARLAVMIGVFCKIHHFEMIQKKECPFSD